MLLTLSPLTNAIKKAMLRNRKNILTILLFLMVILFLLASCSKNTKKDQLPEGKTVTVEGMETVKGTNPPKVESPPAKKPTSQPPSKTERETTIASMPSRPSYSPSPSLPFFQLGFKKKVAILDFENKTTYKDEQIGEAVAKRLFDKLESSQRIVTVDRTVVSETLRREGFKFETLMDPTVMKQAHQSLGIQAFAFGTVNDLSLLSPKVSDTSEEEATSATLKLEIRLMDASTGNLLKTFIGRSPIFGTRETGENSKSKAVLKAIELSLDDIFDGFLRQLDLLEWTTTVAKVEGDSLYLNAGKSSGLRIGDTLEVFEPGKEIIHPVTKFSLGWTTGQSRGVIKVTDLFGVDAAIGKVVRGQGFDPNDIVKSMMQ
jgi:hypothetical protein